ncbi:MAG TPA: hypothetical protein VG096_02120 [Bryobacteraceae bacterium]|nr:hypothetical protein [Bryobacteraceae bacterium]
MFAPRGSPISHSEGQSPKPKEIVLCEGSPLPLVVPRALIATIWDQVNQGRRAVFPGAAEVGGLFLASRSQTSTVLAEAVAPVHFEHQYGPSFRLSPSDLKGIEVLMTSLQQDPAKAVVGFYRSRTRNDSLSEDSETTILAALEQSHSSFNSDFHYFVVFTPLSKLRMTASACFRTDEGWGPWQQVTLLKDSSPQAVDFALPASASQASPPPSTSPGTGSVSMPVADHLSQVSPAPFPSSEEPRKPLDAAARVWDPPAEPDSWPGVDWPLPEASSHEDKRSALFWWYAGAALLAAIALGTYLRMRPATAPLSVRETISSAKSPDLNSPPAPAAVNVQARFLASWEDSVWKLTWDPVAVEALHPLAAVLSIRDGGKERRIHLASSDLMSGSILYPPQSDKLLFSLNLVMRGGQMAEEHIRIMDGTHIVEAPEESISRIVERRQERTPRQLALTSPSPFAPRPTAKLPTPQKAPRAYQSTYRVYPIKPFPVSEPSAAKEPSAVNTKDPTVAPARPTPPEISRSAPDAGERLPVHQTQCCTAIATYEAAAPNGFERVVHRVPVLRRLSPPRAGTNKGFVPPRPLHDIQFTLPPDASSVLREKNQMDLRASVDASGRVIRVKLLSPRDVDLAKLVAYAANGWRFEPAALNEQRVPGEIILHFNFDTNSTAQNAIDQAKNH